MDIVERVAKAICRAWFYCDLDKPDGQEHWRKNKNRCMAEARAALVAMREPTDAMLERALGEFTGYPRRETFEAIYIHMMDAALAPSNDDRTQPAHSPQVA